MLNRRGFLSALGVGAALLKLRPRVIINRNPVRTTLATWDAVLKHHYPESRVLALTQRDHPWLPGDKVQVDDGNRRFVTYVKSMDRERGIITFDTRPA